LHGPAICYSWPSRGEVAAYTADEATVSWSAPHFEQLLVDLHKRTQCRQINVIAHSMGNRALLEAIERIDLRRSALDLQQDTRASDGNLGAGKLIDSLVMAAPDVDMQQFSSRYAKPLRNVAARATLYFSENDRALQLSATIHGSSRLGFDAEKLRSLTGIEPILVDTGDFLSLGHSYYADDPAVVQDLRDLLHGRQPAAQRQLLRSVVTDSGLAYWQLDRGLHAQLPTIRNR
jgi:esterase/lipase superfamily enzyme